jgi:hypothetical protein
MKWSWRAADFLTIHLNDHELICSKLSIKPKVELQALEIIPLPEGSIGQHLFNPQALEQKIKSFLFKHNLEKPLTAISCQPPLIIQALSPATGLNSPNNVCYPISSTMNYSCQLLATTQFQLQLLSINQNLRCFLVTSKLRAVQEAVSRHQQKKITTSCQTLQEYEEYLSQQLDQLLIDSYIEIAPALDADLYKELIAECVGLYYLGKREYGTI